MNNSPVTSKDDAIVDVIIPAVTVVKSAGTRERDALRLHCQWRRTAP